VPSWYVEVTKFKGRMVELNKKINWIPDHIRDGQFGKWLANAHDWAISRNRFWGAPIPVWKTPSGKMKVFGSIAEMEEFFGVEIPDLHRPFIDELTAKDEETGETYTRVPEVLDCWFESGSMPFAELHYPFENKEKFECRFPADFIVEYVAQTRGWFYTLMVLSTALFDEIPFKNCICHGVILGEPIKNPETGKMEKQKLSKRLRNYPDPLEAFEQYGADAIRWMMVSSPIMNGGELSIAKDGSDMHEVIRLVIKPIWNAYHFFTLYANSDGIKAEERFDSENLMDRYILSKLKVAVDKTDKSLENYNTADATQAIEEFFEVLNNWYIRRSRERFWRSMDDRKNIEDKKAAYDTLYTCLINILKVAAPIIPFISEYIFKNLTGEKSVHLQSFPNIDIEEDSQLINNMDKVRDVCNVGLSIRNAENVRIRQPLANIHIFGDESVKALESYKDIILDELNVKNIEISTDLANKADLTLKINFPVLGKRLPAKMKQIIPASKKGEWKQLENGNIEIAGEELFGEEFEVKLQSKDDKTAQPLSTNDALVALDLNITDELAKEGIARDIVRLIQQARKDADLNISDHIDLVLSNLPDQAKDAVKDNHSYIAEQTLSANISVNSGLSQKFKNSYPLGDSEIEIGFDVTKRDVA
jgi:isoleucyl-tRNA synthetase